MIVLKDITKVYESPSDDSQSVSTFVALKGVSLEFSKGEIHTILGENGAGKSTLMHILSGLFPQTGGSLFVNGTETRFRSPENALSHGIAMVHQRPLLAEYLTVLENCVLGTGSFFCDYASAASAITQYADQWQFAIDPRTPISALEPGKRLYAAMLAALYRKPQFLILDEPTAVLPPEARDTFMENARRASQGGLGIILITHKLDEAVRWSDRVTILKQGTVAYSGIPVNKTELEAYLTHADNENHPAPYCEIIAESAGLSVSGLSVAHTLDIASFEACPGKITAIIGTPGSGIPALEDVLTGMTVARTLNLTLTGSHPARLKAQEITPERLARLGIQSVPSKRSFRGSHPDLTIEESLFPGLISRDSLTVNPKRLREMAASLLQAEGIQAHPSRKTRTLSGGQLQRLLLARALAQNPKILILCESEWGLDIQSVKRLRTRLRESTGSGMTILVLTDSPDSSDNDDFYDARYYLKEGTLI